MRNRITIITILLSLILLVYAFLQGIKIGDFQVLSIFQLIEKNDALNAKIEEASELTTNDYNENVKTLEETFEEYKIQKQKYEDLVGVTSGITDEIFETKQYDIGYLWKVLGKYAEKRSVSLEINIQKSTTLTSSYDINFTVSGKYVNISQFITDIENDSDLYFRIYNFTMSGSSEIVLSTFTVRNVNIDSSTITK